MNKVRFLFKKALTPVTIMVIPHDNLRSQNIKIPAIKIFFTMLLNAIGGFCIFSLFANGLEYPTPVKGEISLVMWVPPETPQDLMFIAR